VIGTRAFLLAAGRGMRFRPVTESIPKPLAPYLNVPLARAHLRRLLDAGISEAAVNLHHLGDEIVKDLVDHSAELPKLRFFPEPEILGTAGGLRNAAAFLRAADFLVVNSDAAIEPDYASLLERHRETGRAATLLVVENRDLDRYTPLQSEGDRITGFGREAADRVGIARSPLLYTGVCVLAPRLLERIPPGETSLVADLWGPLIDEGREEIGWLSHQGPFADLGSPRDFLSATLEALARGGPFPPGAGRFDETSRVLALGGSDGSGFEATNSVLGASAIGDAARIESSAVWPGCEVGAGAKLTRCLAASGRIAPGTVATDVLFWGRAGDDAALFPLR
jgi:NDP-sugar pyrophosphorylase family protein